MSWTRYGHLLGPMLLERRPRYCVEVGAWLGNSSIMFAETIAQWGGTLICVDHWQGSPDFARHPFMAAQLSTAEATFRARIRGHENVVVLKMASVDAAQRCAGAEFIYIDASHEEADVRADLAAWGVALAAGGLMAGDDYGDSEFPGVTAAWDDVPGVHYSKGKGQWGLVWVERKL